MWQLPAGSASCTTGSGARSNGSGVASSAAAGFSLGGRTEGLGVESYYRAPAPQRRLLVQRGGTATYDGSPRQKIIPSEQHYAEKQAERLGDTEGAFFVTVNVAPDLPRRNNLRVLCHAASVRLFSFSR